MSALADHVARDIPLNQIDVSQPAIYRDDTWQALFARLRNEAPVHYLADSPVGPFWSVTTHALIKEVDGNHQAFSSEAGGISLLDDVSGDREVASDIEGVQGFITMDPPKHAAQRKAVQPVVAPNNLATLEPLIRERVIDILERLPINTTFNWVEAVSIELTARMLATILDFPYEERSKLIHWSDLVTDIPLLTGGKSVDPKYRNDELVACAMAFHQLWHECKAQPPKADLISMLVHSEATKDMIDNPKLFMGNLFTLIVGGNDTTRNTISGGVLGLNRYPNEYEKLKQDHSLIPNMVAEFIRWQTPVIHMRRTATCDIELGGQQIKAGDKVVMWYLSGNRDEAVFEDAETLKIDRDNARQHVSFGYGIHRCMGNRLAELQLRVLWEEIMNRFERIEVVGDVERLANSWVRGIQTLPVRIHKRP
jgi:cytochrome P450